MRSCCPFFEEISAPLMLLICIGYNGNARRGKEMKKTSLILKTSCSGMDVSSRIVEVKGIELGMMAMIPATPPSD